MFEKFPLTKSVRCVLVKNELLPVYWADLIKVHFFGGGGSFFDLLAYYSTTLYYIYACKEAVIFTCAFLNCQNVVGAVGKHSKER